MVDLLSMLNQGQYGVGVEELLQTIHPKGPNNPERVLRLFECEICTTGTRIFRTLIVSNLNLYVMDKPTSAMHCGVCPPEKFCPHAPKLERSSSYGDICRLVKGYGSQALIIGWITPDGGESFEHIVCHRSRDRDILVEMVHTLSGKSQSKSADLQDCAALCGDSLVREVIKEAVGVDDQIFALTYAIRQDKDRLSLFVLTDKNIFEFQVNFDAYGFNPDMPESGDPDDEIGPQVAEDATELMLDEMTKGVDPSLREAKSRSGGSEHESSSGRARRSQAVASKLKAVRERRNHAMQKGDDARLDTVGKGPFGDLGLSLAEKRDALTKKMKSSYLVPLVAQPVGAITMIGFMPGETPVLRLDAGEPMVISFFDDLAREDWRRALACALNQADGGPAWARQYATAGELG